MKKIFALILTVALILSFSVSAFALKSAGGTEFREVIVNRTNDGKNSSVADRVTVEKDGTIALKPVENDNREFEGWKFYKPNKSPALAGTDYEIVSVTLPDGTKAVEGTDYVVKNGEVVSLKGDYINVVIKPLSDTVYVSEAYEGVEIDFNVPKDTVNPLTGESVNLSVIATLVMLVLGGAALAVSSKRAFN